MSEILIDSILPAQSIYVQEVIAAEQEYQAAVRNAWKLRQTRVDRALTTCLIALGVISEP